MSYLPSEEHAAILVSEAAPVKREITIRGLPILSGKLLLSDSPAFDSLRTIEDFVTFARQLRGQFCIVVQDGARFTAITDFGCSRPVFYWRDPKESRHLVSATFADLTPFSQKRLRKEALFFYVTRGGVGISPFYSDIDEVRPATVMCFQDGRIESQTYLNWQDFLEIHPIDPAAAQQRFTEIASGYLSALVKDQGAVGCLLSGGTDSALIAWLLREIGANTLCLTADYSWEKYSEFSSAAATAAAVGLAHERVPITASNRRDSLYALNNARQNAPCSVGLSPILYQLAGAASKHGISILATGDHADSLFLGFERFFHSFPAEHEAYLKATAALTPAARIASLNSRTAPHPADEPLLAALGSSAGECLEWENALFEEDCARLSQWAGATPLHTLQQLTGQLWAGISFQNLFLPVTQALDHRIEFVSPFYDLEMIRFALSLPAEYKFRNGATKVLLRDLLARTLGRAVAKRASPNPARFWRLMPDLRERSLQGKALRPVYDRACFRNLVDMGASWNQVDKVGALGMWLTAQG